MSSYYFLNDFWQCQKESFDQFYFPADLWQCQKESVDQFYFPTDLWQCQKESFDSQRRRNQQWVKDVIPAGCRWETQQHKCRAFEGAEIHQWSEGSRQFDVGEEEHPKYGVDEEAEHEQGHDVDDGRQGDDQGEHHFAQAFGHLSPQLSLLAHARKFQTPTSFKFEAGLRIQKQDQAACISRTAHAQHAAWSLCTFHPGSVQTAW